MTDKTTQQSISSRRLLAVLLLGAGLAACQAAPQPPTPISTTVTAPTIAGQVDPEEGITFAFEPFTGAPGNIADELSEMIGSEARKQGITLVRRTGAAATYRVNGYLSATGQPSNGTVFYVFDIVDSSGRRVKRISGTEDTGGASGDPWQAVSSGTLSRIANRSMVEIKAWLNR
ncbi:hypothetical protein FIV06_13590 [Labrenzia sp. THAF191b]|uniref:hypothetical protein n=1 Tax=unclassified Labrenzia TaxID=2648686 RepID=UPI001268262D|nr:MULTISPECIES: hypothetical protein [unclassified Labrenzia]QFS98455.1 hypothetical protein FIV06_13590 [Labrenzia sp. THAF191b]QFT04769.1 hypothetical protein FIV05_13585 [Labrenzia sp. THAF191a]QFT16313.1 hypothetical protein FIV03_13600 [Labrenzia sp. THAF187b]